MYDSEIIDIGPREILRRPTSLTVSVVCTWSPTDGFRDWFEPDTAALVQYMLTFDYLIGFNTIKFDNPVIYPGLNEAYSGKFVDMFADIHEATGRMYGLKAVTQANCGSTTDEEVDGAAAPKMWASGKRLEVIRYCRNDVEMTTALLRRMLNNNPLTLRDKYNNVKRRNVPLHARTSTTREPLDYESIRQCIASA